MNIKWQILSKHYEVYKKHPPAGFIAFCAKNGNPNPNTCAVRLSAALKRAYPNFFLGIEAPLEWEEYDLPTRAAGLAVVLNKRIRKATLISGSSEISGKNGIVFFDFKSPGHTGATGHISLWDGIRVVDEGDYFAISPRKYFWELK